MACFRYHMTFIDEVAEPAVQVIRAKSCPPMPKTLPMPKDATKLHAMREQKQRALQVSKLQERSQLVSTGQAAPHEIGGLVRQAIPSLGSYGHPNICRRPCILMVKGTCQKGSDCGFCHQDHELRPPSFDKQQREFLKRLPAVTFMELILPYVREKVEASELPGAHQVLQLLKSEIIVRAVQAPVGNRVQRTPRRIRFVLERMSLSNLVSVICLTLPGVFPKLMANELKDLRETARILEA